MMAHQCNVFWFACVAVYQFEAKHKPCRHKRFWVKFLELAVWAVEDNYLHLSVGLIKTLTIAYNCINSYADPSTHSGLFSPFSWHLKCSVWSVLDYSLCSICLSSTSGFVIWHASHCTDHEPCLGDSPYIHLSSTWSWAFLPLSLGICRLVCNSFLIDDHFTNCATFFSLKHWGMDHDSGIQSHWWLITLSPLLYLDWC